MSFCDLDWSDWTNSKPASEPWQPNNGQCICEIHRQFASQHGHTVNEWYAAHPEIKPEWMERCGNCHNFAHAAPAVAVAPSAVLVQEEPEEMSNNISIQNIVSIGKEGGEASSGFGWLLKLLVGGALFAGVCFGLYWLVSLALELVVAIGEGIGDMIGVIATALLDTGVTVGRVVIHYAPTALWALGYGCVALVGVALLVHVYERWIDSEEADWVTVARPMPPQRVLIVVGNQEQAQQAVKLLPESVSYEFIQMPAQKEVVYHER